MSEARIKQLVFIVYANLKFIRWVLKEIERIKEEKGESGLSEIASWRRFMGNVAEETNHFTNELNSLVMN